MSCTDTLNKLCVISAARGLSMEMHKRHLKSVVSAGPGGAGRQSGTGPDVLEE